MDAGSGKTHSSVPRNSALIIFSFLLYPSDTSRASLNEHLTPAQRVQPLSYTFLPTMFVSPSLKGSFATTATFDDEIIVDSSHLSLLTWPCPR